MADERDPKLSQHYRSLEALEPPAELDLRILAAAREREGAHAPLVVPAGRHRWYYSLAAAAVLMLAVAVTLHVERDRPDPELSATAQPEPEPRREAEGRIGYADPKPQATPPARTEEQEKKSGKREAHAPDPQKQEAPAEREPAPAPNVALSRQQDAAASSPRAESRVAESRARVARDSREAQAAAQERAVGELSAMKQPAPASAAGAVPPAAPVAAPPEKPERWLERIAEMRSRGRHAEADKELAEFRRVYPKFPISEVMRERVEGR